MAGIKWSKEEDGFLKENYENMSKDELLSGLLKRSWDAIKIRAEKMNIRRYNKENRLADLKILLDNTNKTYYWIGFIMADAHIENDKRLSINLSIKDEDHLNEFKKFIRYDNDLQHGINNTGHNYVNISIMDTKYVKKLCDKFDIKHNKTYNPCDIKKIINDDLLLSLIVGFIDGDGSIKNQTGRKDFRLGIKCHRSWYDNLEHILNTIIRITGVDCETSVKYTKCKRYSLITITNSSALKKLKRKILELNIPYMKRKWDVINDDFESRYETKKKNKNELIQIINNNKNVKVKDIAKSMNLSEETIYNYKRQLKYQLG